ncbi:hypothetical protein E3U23_05625 [Erythrobacter litoralis]|uniref:TPM domain-containing protein n=1 Tax=Erythrobacter litoralis TaxID=39960 RepID=UPI002435F82D|nr:hypothetical protein [Erythrobacter litoralis]MDG6078670.1 hypothetical protein [Erythrobacter litoralis]
MRHLSDEQASLVSRAVTEAEDRTSGEIVPVLADRSDGYTDVALWWALGLSFTVMSLFAALPTALTGLLDTLSGGWMHDWTDGEILATLLAIGLVVFALGLLFQLFQPLKFALVPAPVRSARTRDAAIRHFKVGAERRTHGRTGVLLYVSMREHRAEIVADESIVAKVEAEVWGEAMADMLSEIREGRLAEGLAAGIRDVGAVLAEHFPRDEHDENELPDRLIEV